jgi:hypothetical protein
MFDLTNDDLAYAICLLKDRHPEVICRRAWEIITTEQERRYATKGFVKDASRLAMDRTTHGRVETG